MKKPCVVIDAGHGGHDPGAVGPTGLEEKTVALAVCMMVAESLRPQCKVVLTRDNDTFVTLAKRAMIANEAGADAFVSIHCNSGPPGMGTGFEVWTTPGKTRGDALATALYERFSAEFPAVPGRPDFSDADPDKEAGFAVLRLTRAPAALFELEFIHTPAGEKRLKNSVIQSRMATALARGVKRFLTGGKEA